MPPQPTRRFGRHSAPQLFPSERSWDQIEAPRPRSGGGDQYQKKWRAYVAAAQDIGWSPDDVTEHGTQAMAVALNQSQTRQWSPSTVTLMAKLARFAGVDHRRHPKQPASSLFDGGGVHALWAIESIDPVTRRTQLAAAITWSWPAQLDTLLALRFTDLTVAKGAITIDRQIRIPNAGELLNRWRTSATTTAPTDLVFTTAKPSRRSNPGSPLSVRQFEHSFQIHCQLNGLPGLTWQRLRTAALRQPHATRTRVGRGLKTALRDTTAPPGNR